MPLPLIEAAPRNPKRHDAAGIRVSIERHGVAELPLLDERTGRLVAGHGRCDQLAAMHRAGQDPPDGVQVGADGIWLVPVLRGWASRSDAEAEAYVVASNKLTMNGGWDTTELPDILTDLAQQGLLGLTGFDEDELAKLLDGGASGDSLPEEGDADVDDVDPTWGVVVICRSEQEQVDLLQRMADEGRTVKALM
jgi:hypothetical protein